MNPFEPRGRVRAIKRGQQILARLAADGVLTPVEYEMARRQIVRLEIPPRGRRPEEAMHAVLRFEELLTDPELRRTLASDPIVDTTLDLDLQREVSWLAWDAVRRLERRGAGNAAVQPKKMCPKKMCLPQKNVPARKKCACPKKMCLTFCKSPQLAGRRSAGHRGGRPRAARNAVADTAAARSPRPLPRRIGRGRRRGFRLLARRLAAAAAGGGDAGSRTGAFARIPESTPKRSSMPSSRMSAADVGSPGPRPSPCRSRACSIPVRAPTRAKRSKP